MKRKLMPLYAPDTETGGGDVHEATDVQEGIKTENSTTEAQAENSSDTKLPDSDIEKRIQEAVEREKKKLNSENIRLKKELETMKSQHMSAEEIKQADMKEMERELLEREVAVKQTENRLYAIKAIKEAGLDNGDDKALALAEFVMERDEATMDARVKSFGELVNRFVKDEVEKTFKAYGRNPYASNTAETNSNNKESIAQKLGKASSESKKISDDIINHYIGGR